jgi:casein kinase II subunit alpha
MSKYGNFSSSAKEMVGFSVNLPVEHINWKTLKTHSNKDHMDPMGLELVDLMLVYDHTKRISAVEALMHPYFDSVRTKSV